MTIHFTRCPQCRTTFRITSQQLALREGRARCGHCRTVFNAFAALVNFKGERVPGPGMEPIQRDTMTLRDSVFVPESAFTAMPPSPAPSDTKAGEAIVPPALVIETANDILSSSDIIAREKGSSLLMEEDAFAIDETTDEKPYHKKTLHKDKPSPLALVLDSTKKPSVWQQLHLPPWCRPLFYLISLPLLTALLAAQAVFYLHDELADAYPKLTPTLALGCRWLHCEIKPLQNLDALTIEASDLQSDPNDAQQLLLIITLRNRSGRPVAYPNLSLELTDSQDRLMARRFFTPDVYLVRAADANIGAPAARDLVLRLLLRSDVTASGYRLSLVYS
ncbi:MAG: zinc-ribbon and DUF3426 domain-containing protein [Burkholderiales bacterium]|jgi:predicted Zn finger-like uncharacterized protein|nr:zinc-ribbon and DUF3426 domain-containing protein [Burkholderiales bacterium]